MGAGSYSDKDWKKFSSSRSYGDPKTTTDHIYARRVLDEALDPRKFTIRESVDSIDNPESTPIIIGQDVTGSMDPVLDAMARTGMKTVCEEIYKRKPVTDPHICTLGIGDVEVDHAPFQATQFEADIRIFEQLEKLYLERGGGGNDFESYILAWYFAKYRTKTDSFGMRGRKGFIFTIGDEEITRRITAEHFRKFLGGEEMRTMTAQELFDMTFPEWNIFHVIVKQGSHASRYYDSVRKSWEDVIGVQRVISLDDHTKIGEVIVSTLEVASGKNLADVTESWSDDTSIVVGAALQSVSIGDLYQSKQLDSCL